jgi:hypothetical protein
MSARVHSRDADADADAASRAGAAGPRPGGQLDAYLALLAGPAPAGKLLEIRHRTPDGRMRQLFIPARRPDLAAATITHLGAHLDVYIGVVLRTRRRGGRDSLHDSHLVFCDIDHPNAQQHLARFPHPPTATIASGTTGHRHAYWALHAPIDADQVAAANRRLAHALNGDLAATDAARVLRPPGTRSFKQDPSIPIRLVQYAPAHCYDIHSLLHGLPDPVPRRPARRDAPADGHPQDAVDARLTAVGTSEYVERLTGRRAGPDGKVACPFHKDHTPSLHCYPDGTFYCFGACRSGGSIYDFASKLWSIPTKGPAFLAIRSRLVEALRLER